MANLQNLQVVHHVEMHITNAKTQAYQATLKDRVVHCGAGTTHQWGLRQARRPHSAMSEHQQKKMLSAGNTSYRVSTQTERRVAISAAISAHILYFQRGLGNHLWFRQGSQTMFLWQNVFFLAVWTVLGKNGWGFAGDRFGVCFQSFQHFVD